jgi:hypothetical protein
MKMLLHYNKLTSPFNSVILIKVAKSLCSRIGTAAPILEDFKLYALNFIS